MYVKKIGLIAGEGNYPVILAENASKEGVEIIAVGIKNKTKKTLKKHVSKLYFVKLGEFRKLIDYFKKHSIDKAIMAGKVPKVSIFDVRIIADKELKELMARVKDNKDTSLLGEIANVLEENGIHLMDSTMWMDNFLPSKGVLGSINPTVKETEDINFGKEIAKNIAGLDIGQTIAVKDKTVLAVEAMEHTDQTIKRAGKLGKKGIVIIKVSRPNQDMRFDVPVIGLETIKSLVKVKAKVLAIESGKTLLFDLKKIKQIADKHNISIIAF